MMNTLYLLAQSAYTDSRDDVAAGMLFLGLMIFTIAVVISLIIYGLICLLLFLGYNPLPNQYKRMPSWQILLLFIPLFNIYWNFRVFTAIPDSYKAYFHSQGRTEFGDCGRTVGLYFSIAFILCHIPCLNYLVPWVALILVGIFIVKLFNMKSALNEPAPAPGITPGITPGHTPAPGNTPGHTPATPPASGDPPGSGS